MSFTISISHLSIFSDSGPLKVFILFITFLFLFFFFKLGFTPHKAEKPLQIMELQEKEAQKDYIIQGISLERPYG